MTTDARELAWASGVFEGEGSFSGGVLPEGRRRFISATFTSTDLDVVERIMAAFGFGNIYPRDPDYPGAKKQYQWQAGSFEQVQQVIAALWFGLGRRRQARAAKLLTDYLQVTSQVDLQRRRQELIRAALRGNPRETQSSIARRFGVSDATVCRIKKDIRL